MSSSCNYSYNERIWVGPRDEPFNKNNNKKRNRRGPLVLDIRLESDESLAVESKKDNKKQQPRQATTTTTTPFSNQVVDWLNQYDGIVRNVLVQMGSHTSQSFPARDSTLDYYRYDGHSINNNHDHYYGPAGIAVRVQFLLSEEAQEHYEDIFYSIVQELVNTRTILAPIESYLKIQRLHKYLQTYYYHDDAGTTIIEYELVLPSESSTFSAEAMREFLSSSSSYAATPCNNQAGIWSLFNTQQQQSNNYNVISTTTNPKREEYPNILSNHLMGISAPSPTTRRSWWIQFQQDNTASNETTTTYTVSKGIQYSVRTKSSDKQQQGQQHPISISTLFPNLEGNKNNPNLICVFSDSTEIKTIQDNNSGSSRVLVPRHNSNHDANNNDNNSIVVVDLAQQQMFQHERNNQQSSTDYNNWNGYNNDEPFMVIFTDHDDDRTNVMSKDNNEYYFHVGQTILRTHGLANTGTIRLTVSNFQTCFNNDHSNDAKVQFQQYIPPVIQPKWQSLQFHLQENNNNNHDTVIRQNLDKKQLHVEYQTVRRNNKDDSKQNLILKYEQLLPCETTLVLSLDYLPAFLPFENFPGDANRGIELPPATATVFYNATAEQNNFVRLYSHTNLLLPPVPDMSMPFNVLSLTCTLYAFVFGSVINLLVRKSSERIKYELHPELKPKRESKLKTLKTKLSQKLQALKAKLKGEKTGDDDDSVKKAETEDGETTTSGDDDSGSSKDSDKGDSNHESGAKDKDE